MVDGNKLEGAFDEAKGKGQQALGDASDDKQSQGQGQMDEAKGKGKQALGDAQDQAKDKAGDLKDKIGN